MDNSVKFRIEFESNGKKVFGELGVSAEDLKNAIGVVANETRKLDGIFDGVTKKAVLMSSLNSIIGQLSGMVGSLADGFNSFDKGMRAVNTMAGKDKGGLAVLKGQVEELAAVIPLAKSELAGGLYQVISNGVPEDNWIAFLEKSARSAVGGMADLGQTVTVTSTIIKNYGLEWSAAGDIQDRIQMTAKNGVTSFEQLAAALPRVSGNAATLGVSVDELMASFATLTGVSGNTAEVSTQLAAVFTALVKPSSEASEMAQMMGVRFDAAAMKAAGGMRNFLTSLNAGIQQYASAHGMLEQEIYGKLFGSAEALRALIPLTGELSDTFESNIEAMAGSCGTIDAAFDSMAGSGESVTRMLGNQVSTFFDWAGSVASAIQPYLSFAATSGQAVSGMIVLSGAVKKTAASLVILAKAHKSNAVVAALCAVHTKVVAAAQKMLAACSVPATAGTWALNAAVAALYATLTFGISAVISVVVKLFGAMGDEAEEAGGKVGLLKDANDEFKRTVGDVKAEIDLEIVSLSDLIRQHGNEAAKVEELNGKYGDVFGKHKTASEWYDTLTGKSKAYCLQLGYEAQAKIIASKRAEKEMERESARKKVDDLRSSGKATVLKNRLDANNRYITVSVDTEEYAKAKGELATLDSEITDLESAWDAALKGMADAQKQLKESMSETTAVIDWQKMSYNELGKAIEDQKKTVGSLAGTDDKRAGIEAAKLQRMQQRYKGLGEKYGLASASGKRNEYDGKSLIANAATYKALGNNIAFYRAQLEQTDPKETGEIRRLAGLVSESEKAQDAIRRMIDAYDRPASLDTLEDIDRELRYQQSLRARASATQIASVDAEIRRLNDLKTALEDSAHVPVAVDQIKTYDELDRELAFYERRLKAVSGSEREEVQGRINGLRRLKDGWDEALESLSAPGDISVLNTMDELDKAVSYYSNREKKASAAELEGIRRTIIALREKRDAMAGIAGLSETRNELGKLEGLDDRQLGIELKLIGLEDIQARIRSLQKLLDNTSNPLDEDQRKEVESQIDTWRGYEKIVKKSALTGDKVTGVMGDLGTLMGNLSGVVGEGASGWLTYGANILQAVAQALPALASVIGGNIAQAFSGAAAQSQTVPFPLNLVALAASMAAVTAAVMSIPKFADGGIAYGPTLGLFGEYAGAASNPEVVAPLDRLKHLIADGTGPGNGGTVEFRIEGRTLVGILKKMSRLSERV